MKKLCVLALALLIGLLPVSGLAAAVRYPELSGAVTDASGVLSESTVADILKLQTELEDEDADLNVNVVTVDFLDGQSVQSYADALFAKAKLDDETILLLVAVGEDSYAASVGKDAAKDFSQSYLQSALISTGFAENVKAQRYDAAMSGFFAGLIKDVESKRDVSLPSSLFGQSVQTHPSQTQQQGTSYSQMLDNLIASITQNASEYEARPVDNIPSRGLGPAGWIVLVVLILLVFSQSDPARKYKRNGCTGCGCAPFSSLLSAMGLASLIDHLSQRGGRRRR